MIELTNEIQELWDEETYKVHESEPMLSWDACAMIAWNKISQREQNENFNWKISKEG